MNERYYGRIIGKNLKRIAYDRGKTQADISKDLDISKSTLSSWMNGTRVPRMDKIDLLCEYFNCTRDDIMKDQSEEPKPVSKDIVELEYRLVNIDRELMRLEKEKAELIRQLFSLVNK